MELSEKLLEVIENNLTSEQSKAIQKRLNQDNKREKTVDEKLRTNRKQQDDINFLQEKSNQLETAEKRIAAYEAREQEVLEREKALDVELLKKEIKEVKLSRTEIQNLVATLFQNKNISHFVNASGNIDLYTPTGSINGNINLSGEKSEQ